MVYRIFIHINYINGTDLPHNACYYGTEGGINLESPINEKLNSTLELLLNRIEKIQIKENVDSENTEKIITAMDRLSEGLEYMDGKRREEEELISRLDLMARSMEKLFSDRDIEMHSSEGIEKTLRKIVHGVKVFGQILAILAGSVQIAVDSVGSVLGNKNSETLMPNSSQAKTQADLAMLLQPLTSLVQGLVEEKMKNSAQSIADEGDSGKDVDTAPGEKQQV
jgi:hypothetical protein